MRGNFILLKTALFMLLGFYSTSAQNVIEVKETKLSKNYKEVLDKLKNMRSEPEAALDLLTRALPELSIPYERFDFIFNEIPSLYSEIGKCREAFEMLKTGQREGFFYPFILGQNKFPPFAGNFEKFEDFKSFLDENKKLREEAQKKTKFEYVVKLPENYSEGKRYPLLIVLYGGFGSHTRQIQDWHSKKLGSSFITAYMQGDQLMGSYLRSYRRDDVNQFIEAYKQIISNYPIDTSRVLIGAQSAGAHHSFMLMLDELIPVKGMILAFPGTPQLDPEKIKKAAGRGVSIVILAGGKDPRVDKTRAMSAEFDQLELDYRLIVFPDKGHEFPDDFPGQIDLAIDFIMKAKSLD